MKATLAYLHKATGVMIRAMQTSMFTGWNSFTEKAKMPLHLPNMFQLLTQVCSNLLEPF